MKEIIQSVLQAEKEAQKRLEDANRKAGEIKKECDRELAERNRRVKEELSADYQSRTAAIREELEKVFQEKLKAEESRFRLPLELNSQPYDGIVGKVSDLITGLPDSPGE